MGALALGATTLREARHSAAGATDATPAATPALAHWTYEGDEDPAHWSEFDPTYALCSTGRQQSPIDVVDPTHVDLADVVFDNPPIAPLRIVNNGHTIQVNVDPGSAITLGGVECGLANSTSTRRASIGWPGRSRRWSRIWSTKPPWGPETPIPAPTAWICREWRPA